MYYIRVSGQVYGPYPQEQLKSFVSQGRLVPHSEVSVDGQTWVTASTIPGLFAPEQPGQNYPGYSQPEQQAYANPYVTPETYDSPMAVDPLYDPNRSFTGCYIDVWRKFSCHTGRSRRKEYWAWSVFNTLFIAVWAIIMAICIAISDINLDSKPEWLGIVAVIMSLILCVFVIAAIIPGINLYIRRMHDMNASGWWVLCIFILYVSAIYALVIGIIDGTTGPNRYGPDPKGRG